MPEIDYHSFNTETYDVIIVGAGISGCCLAYFLHQAKKRVLLIDKEGVASGGSGAAGAFISPKFTRDPYQLALSQKSHHFALEFFNKQFPQYIQNSGLLHLASSAQDEKKIAFYTEHNPSYDVPDSLLKILKTEALKHEHIFLKDSAMVDAKGVCEALIEDVDFMQAHVKRIEKKESLWQMNGVCAKELVLATGAYEDVVSEPYLEVQAVWGHRINVVTSLQNQYNIHQKVSISPTQKQGFVAIGATHNRNYHPQKNKKPYDIESGRQELLLKASYSVDLGKTRVLDDFTGLRASYYDHLPVIGALVKAKESLEKEANLVNGARVKSDALLFHNNLSVINGMGGYGFCLAPYMASLLAKNLIDGTPIDETYQTLRLFKRWVKRKT